MKNYITIMCMFFACMAMNAQTTVMNQAEWDLALPGAGVSINNGEIIIGAGAIIEARGISVNTNGILTIMPGASLDVGAGMFVDASSTLNNYGTLTSTTAGLDWQGTIVNTGTVTISAGIAGAQNVLNCGTITHAPGVIVGNGPAPIDSPCDDGDAATLDDVITDANCTCAGAVEPPVAAVPTMGEWGLMIMGLLIMIFGVVALQARRETVLS